MSMSTQTYLHIYIDITPVLYLLATECETEICPDIQNSWSAAAQDDSPDKI